MDTNRSKIYWDEAGPSITFDGVTLEVEDLNPHVQMRWYMSRWELFKMGCKAIAASIRKGEHNDQG